MSTLFQIKFIGLALVLINIMGCSVIDSYSTPQPQVQSRSLPKIPEIKRQTVVKPRYSQPRKSTSAPNTSLKINTVTAKKRALARQAQAKKRAMAQQRRKQLAKEKATVDIDPYATIPEDKSANVTNNKAEVTTSNNSTSSPAVRSLMVSARADIALGKNSAAVSKLERGLRIESQNPELWHLLSKANYSNSNYQQSINMAKKSNRYSTDENLIAQNWALIKKSGEKSGNATAIKEALDYIKLNP